MIADIITLSRVLFSVSLLAFQPRSYPFAALYILCGISDILDGFIARKLRTESEKGAIYDSTADLVFAIIYAVKILPFLSPPLWVWIWVGVIGAIKITGIIIKSIKKHKLHIEHSFLNKLTGVLVFILPLSVRIVNISCGASVVCAVATLSAIEEIYKTRRM